MSIEERQREEKEARRRTIIDAAETVLRDTGRDDMTMGDIAEEARLSRSLLYVYFEDMDDIVLAVTLRGLQSMRERFEQAVARHDVGRQQIRAVGDAYVRFAQEEPTYFDLVAQFESRSADPDDAPPRVRQCLGESDRVMTAMTKAIRQGIDDGSIRSDLDPTQTAITLWGCTHGLIQLAANKGESLEQQYGLSPEALFGDGLGFLGVALAGHPLDGAPDATGNGREGPAAHE
jgi:AcrR family transcriptional regulator